MGREFYVIAALIFLTPLLASAQEDRECTDLLFAALSRRAELPDSGFAFYRDMSITVVRRIPAGYDTTRGRAESIETERLQCLRFDSSEIRQDERSMVLVDHRARSVRSVDLAPHRKIVAGQRRLNKLLPDSLAYHARNVQCRIPGSTPSTKKEKGDDSRSVARTITFAVDSSMQRFYNAAAIALDLRPDGEILRFRIDHPSGSPLVSTEYIVNTIDRRYKGMDLTRSVREQFFVSEGKLRPEYQGYRVEDL